MNKPLPKSLHTITVLVIMARLCRDTDANAQADRSWDEYVSEAINKLELTDRPDVYELAAKATQQLER